MEKIIIKVGDKKKHLLAIDVSKDNNIIKCQCDCGKIVTMSHYKFIQNATCGCQKKNKKHGLSKTRIYSIWNGMNQRCYTKTCDTYCHYGAKGITVCDEWNNKNKNGFINFYSWSKGKYNDTLTIDRINPTGNYEPSNCRWATYREQNSHHIMSKNHKTGYRNIYPTKYGTYQVIMSINDKSYNVGSFKNIKDSVEARNKFIEIHNLPNPKEIYDGKRI